MKIEPCNLPQGEQLEASDKDWLGDRDSNVAPLARRACYGQLILVADDDESREADHQGATLVRLP